MDVLNTTGYHRRPPHLVAEYKGFFAAENLEVKFHETTYAPDHNRGMAEGRWDLTLSSADTMIARTTTDGTDYLLFMQAEEGLDVQLVARPEIKTLADLRGKLFAADPVDSNYDLVRNKIMRDNGVAEDEYRIAILGNSSVRATALDEGKVDAAMLQQGRSVPQGVIDQFSGNPEERVVKPFGALSGDLNRMRDRLVGRCASGNQIPRERFQWCMKRLGSGCRRDDLGLIAAFGGTNHARQLPSDWPAELAKHLQP